MGEIFAKILDVITEENSKGLKRLLIFTLILLPLILIIGSYFYENIRLEQRVGILKELASIKESEIENAKLKDYYNELVSTLVKNDTTSFTVIMKANENKFDLNNIIVVWKLISGSVIGVLIMIAALFAKYDKLILKIIGFFVVGIITALVAGLGLLIPTIDPPIINYIGYPVIQLILVIFGTFAFQKKAK
jgi:hypothetical protein